MMSEGRTLAIACFSEVTKALYLWGQEKFACSLRQRLRSDPASSDFLGRPEHHRGGVPRRTTYPATISFLDLLWLSQLKIYTELPAKGERTPVWPRRQADRVGRH